MKIIFIQTGGTIDKDYPRSAGGYAFEFGEPATSRFLEKLDPSFSYEITTAFQKDSLEITDTDRQRLAGLILRLEATKFVVTHGTDTLLETAEFLRKHTSGKLIVLTGAMRPERFYNSDAPINIGTAIAVASFREEGVYVAMHGRVKPSSEMKRDPETGKFY